VNAQDLKNSILQLAIQGKLVEQREEEGTTKELLDRIEAEKKQLIKEGKIKKQKKLAEVTEDEVLFDIPESWQWTRISNIADMYTGNSIPKSIKENKYSKVKEGYDYIGTKDVGFDFTINYDNGIKIPYEEEKFRNSFKDSILMCIEGGSAGRKIGILDKTVCFGNKLCSFTLIFGVPRFLYYYLQSPMFFQAFRDEMTGIIGGVSITKLKSIVIPLPPLEEQKRIVAKIEELMPYVEKYDKAYTEVEELNKKFPEDMQKSILQYAIQGKLVDQREEEGIAEELYQQIQEVKKKLIKEGKIKKTKALPEITEDEIPFNIPESWKWVRLSEVIDVRDGTHDTPAYVPNGYPLITGKDFYNGYFDLSKTQYVSKKDYEDISKRSYVEIGDILFSMIGGNIGSMILIEPENYFEMAIKNVALFKQYIPNMIMSKYLLYYLKSQVSKMKANASGGAQDFVSLTLLRGYLFPIPPLEEQKRIVHKIEELLPYTKILY
jgi:type I restriction enzyme, S subunit